MSTTPSPNACDLCGGTDVRVLFERGRDGPVRNVICQRCGLVQILPRPSEAEIRARYETGDFTSEARTAREPTPGKVYQSEVRALERFRLLHVHADLDDEGSEERGRRSLEVGCGVGSFSRLMQGGGWQAHALEPDPAYAAFGADLYDVDIRPQSYEAVAEQPAAFDLVSAFQVIEHVASPRRFLERARRELRTDGLVFLEMPSINRPWRGRLEEFFWSAHLFTFSEATIAGLLRSVGFEVLATGYRERVALWVLARKTEAAAEWSTPSRPFDDPAAVWERTHALRRAYRRGKPWRQVQSLARHAGRTVARAARTGREHPQKLLPMIGEGLERRGRRRRSSKRPAVRTAAAGLERAGATLSRTALAAGRAADAPKYVAHVGLHDSGNAGDATLFAGVRRALGGEDRASGAADWSLEPVWREVTPLAVNRLNAQARGVVVGGGGLFLPDTNANDVSGWQWPCPVAQMQRLRVPLVVYAAGYNRFRGQPDFGPRFEENVRALVEKSAFVGLRSRGSVRALARYLPPALAEKVVFQPCPTTVLNHLYPAEERGERDGPPVLALNTAFDRHWLRYDGREGPILRAVAAAARQAQDAGWRIALVQHVAPRDATILPWLLRAGVEVEEVNLHARPVEEVMRFYRGVDLAAGMRGHAQMIPFGVGTPILSLISHDKLAWFLDDIGHPAWGVDLHAPDFHARLDAAMGEVLANLGRRRREVAQAQGRLWTLVQRHAARVRRLLDLPA